MNIIELFETIIAYHGTKTPNSRFRASHTGNNSHTFGGYQSTRYGIFFSDNPEFSAMYGTVGQYSLDIKNTLDLDNDNNFVWKWKKSIDAFKDRDFWLTVEYAMHNTWELFEDDVGKRFVKHMHKNGYDSAKFTEYADKNGKEIKSETIVVIDPRLIRKINKPVDFADPDENDPDEDFGDEV